MGLTYEFCKLKTGEVDIATEIADGDYESLLFYRKYGFQTHRSESDRKWQVTQSPPYPPLLKRRVVFSLTVLATNALRDNWSRFLNNNTTVLQIPEELRNSLITWSFRSPNSRFQLPQDFVASIMSSEITNLDLSYSTRLR